MQPGLMIEWANLSFSSIVIWWWKSEYGREYSSKMPVRVASLAKESTLSLPGIPFPRENMI